MTDIVIKIPEEFKPLATAFRDVMAATRAEARAFGRSKGVDYAAVEKVVGEKVAEVEQACHRVLLEQLVVDHRQVRVEGKVFNRATRSAATYYTMAGPIVVERWLYREDGVRNANVVDPVSLRAGMVADYWLPRAARAMAHQLQQGTSREAEQTGRELCRLPYSRSSFERVGHAVGELYLVSAAEVENRLIEEYVVPADAHSVSASLDRVSIPMEEPRKRPPGRPRKYAPKNPIARNYRMGYCGTVTVHDAGGEALHTIRYGCMPQGDAAGLAEALAADVLALVDKQPTLNVVKLLDGSPELWTLLDEQLDESELDGPVVRLLDKWHVLEKLDAAAAAIHGRRAAEAVRRRWRMRLRNSSKGAAKILAELEASGMEWVRLGDRQPVHEAITYLRNHPDRLNYAAARRAGLPVGSGNVEATCKSLVQLRMKRAGSRWKEDSGEHIIQLRALALSDRWGAAMRHTLKPLSRSVRRAS